MSHLRGNLKTSASDATEDNGTSVDASDTEYIVDDEFGEKLDGNHEKIKGVNAADLELIRLREIIASKDAQIDKLTKEKDEDTEDNESISGTIRARFTQTSKMAANTPVYSPPAKIAGFEWANFFTGLLSSGRNLQTRRQLSLIIYSCRSIRLQTYVAECKNIRFDASNNAWGADFFTITKNTVKVLNEDKELVEVTVTVHPPLSRAVKCPVVDGTPYRRCNCNIM